MQHMKRFVKTCTSTECQRSFCGFILMVFSQEQCSRNSRIAQLLCFIIQRVLAFRPRTLIAIIIHYFKHFIPNFLVLEPIFLSLILTQGKILDDLKIVARSQAQANQCLLGAREQLSESPELKTGEQKTRYDMAQQGKS